jgi:hypothetical protein
MKSGKPTQATTERNPGSANTWALPEYWNKPISSRLPHDLTTRQSRIDAAYAPDWVDPHVVHAG